MGGDDRAALLHSRNPGFGENLSKVVSEAQGRKRIPLTARNTSFLVIDRLGSGKGKMYRLFRLVMRLLCSERADKHPSG